MRRERAAGMDWDDVKLFLALLRGGNVRNAAARLGVSHSTVARRIDALENQLQARLFERLPGGYVLTPIGEDMLKTAERVEDELGALERRIAGQDSRLEGSIRVSMIDAFATHLLMPDLAKFAALYPDIELQIPVSYETVDLDRREADVAVRFAKSPPDHLVGRRVSGCAMAPYAAPDYVATHTLDDPDSASWIGYGAHGKYPDWVKQGPFPELSVRGEFVSMLTQFAACKAGMGLAMLPCFMGDREPQVVRLAEGKLTPRLDVWVLTHRDVRSSARIRIFTAFLCDAIASKRGLLEGT